MLTGRCQLALQLLSTDFPQLMNCDNGNLQAIGDPTRTPALDKQWVDNCPSVYVQTQKLSQ